MPAGRDFVFNVVWTGSVFHHLQVFMASLLHHSDARFRFVANACPPDQVAAMEAFAERWPSRVAEVVAMSQRPHNPLQQPLHNKRSIKSVALPRVSSPSPSR